MKLIEKIRGSLILSSYLDTLGSHNGAFEFNFGKAPQTIMESGYVTNEILHYYFSNGGFSNFSIQELKASDDTILLLATGFATLKDGSEKNYIDEYLNVFDKLKEDVRNSGITTINSLEFIRTNRSINKLKYKIEMGGNGAAMRTGVIGLIFNKKDDIDNIIEKSIVASRVTHNYVIGFIPGFIVAIFVNFGMRGIHFLDWIPEMMKLIPKLDKYMESTNINKEYKKDKELVFDLFEEYYHKKVKKFLSTPKHFIMFDDRIKSLEIYNYYGNQNIMSSFGGSGISAVIVAYDSLLLCHNSNKFPDDKKRENLIPSFDSLVYHSTLHFGDCDTTGAIAGMLYGSIYGMKGLDENVIDKMEFKEEIENLINLINS